MTQLHYKTGLAFPRLLSALTRPCFQHNFYIPDIEAQNRGATV